MVPIPAEEAERRAFIFPFPYPFYLPFSGVKRED